MNAIIIGNDKETGSFTVGCPEENITSIEIDISIHGTENTKYIIEQFNMDVFGLGLNDIKRGDKCSLTLE